MTPERDLLTRRPWLAAALAAAAVSEAIQMRFLWHTGLPIPSGFFLSQLLVVTLFHLLAGFVFAGRWRDRGWAAVVFLAPLASPLLFLVFQTSGAALAGVGALALLGLAVVWTATPLGAGAPIVASAVGTASGCTIAWIRTTAYDGSSFAAWTGEAAASVVAAGLLVALAGQRLPPGVRIPSRRVSLATLALALAVALWPARFEQEPSYMSPAAPATAKRPPILLVVLDTVRADHLDLYGYERETMPHLTRFARSEGVVVKRGIANGPWSPPSHGSLFTGLHPPDHGVHYPFVDDPRDDLPHHYVLRDGVRTLASRLRDEGYWTAAINANFGLRERMGLRQGFELYRGKSNHLNELKERSAWHFPGFTRSPLAGLVAALNSLPPFDCCDFFFNLGYYRASTITDRASAVLEAAPERPFFLFVNYADAHLPYRPPYRCLDRFEGRKTRLGLDEVPPPMLRRTPEWITPEKRAHYTALYDGELACLDEALARLLDAARSHPRWEDMLIIVTADHGEALGDHGTFSHSSSLYDEQIRVPFVVKPGRSTPENPAPGSEIDGPMTSVDAFALAMAHAGLPLPEGTDGRPWGNGEARSWLYYRHGWDLPETDGRYRRELRSIERDGWKLIVSTSGSVELYHVRSDPEESRNLATERSGIRDSLLEALGPRLGYAERRPGNAAPLSAEDRRKLRALGYVE